MGTFVSSGSFNFFQLDPASDTLFDFGFEDGTVTTTDGETDTTFEAGDPINYAGLPGTYVGALQVNLDGGGSELLPVIFEDSFYRVLIPQGKTDADYIAPSFTSEATLLSELDTTTVLPVCFAAGTLIATPTGDIAVEELHIGDLISTQDGRDVPVKWIGRQTVVTRFGPAERLMPVRAGALGNGLPERDLTLTADHALLVDGLLINAGALVNGASIDWVHLSEFGESFTVYHVETENHDVILAEGAPAETYIDYVGRQAFDNYADYVALYGEERIITEMPHPRISTARLVPPALKARLAGDAAA